MHIKTLRLVPRMLTGWYLWGFIVKRTIITVISILALAAFAIQAVGQSAFSGAGVIESTSGGFKFPDGTEQTTATPDNLAARLEALENQVLDQPRWRPKIYDSATGQWNEISGMAMHLPSVNRHEDQNLHVVMVRSDTVQGEKWLPAVMGINGIIAFGYQGTDLNHTILAFEPNTDCTGDPVGLILKSSLGDLLDFSRPWFRSYIAYDYRNGNIYGSKGGGNTSSEVNYDLLEYGFDKGYFPNYEGGYGCDQNVDISTRSDLARPDLTSDQNMVLLEPELWANSHPSAGEGIIWWFE